MKNLFKKPSTWILLALIIIPGGILIGAIVKAMKK